MFRAAFLRCAQAPSMRLPCGRVLRTKFHEEAGPEVRQALLKNLPLTSFLYHTVSSGRNLVCLMPALTDKFWKRPNPGDGLQARSACKPGTLFLRHDQMVVLNYGGSQDHESFMPPVLYVDPRDLPTLEDFGEKVWQEQLHGESKKPLTLTFFASTLSDSSSSGEPQGNSTVPQESFDESAVRPAFGDPATGNSVVDQAVRIIRSRTSDYWVEPPQELVQLLSTGDAQGREGTAGFVFPPMMIGNGVFMIMCTYAHSGLLNVIASMLEKGYVNQEDLAMLKRTVLQVGKQNMPYLRALGLVEICSVFDTFFDALGEAQTVEEVHALVRSISMFGAVMHGWFVFLFPYRVGVSLRREQQAALS